MHLQYNVEYIQKFDSNSYLQILQIYLKILNKYVF